MAAHQPILIVENDADDAEFITEAFVSAGCRYPIHRFLDADSAFSFLLDTPVQPFLILCDIQMPHKNGLQFRQQILENEGLRRKSIPFVYFTDYSRRDLVEKAYDLTVQGYFIKAHNRRELADQLLLIVGYWEQCIHPNNEDLN